MVSPRCFAMRIRRIGWAGVFAAGHWSRGCADHSQPMVEQFIAPRFSDEEVARMRDRVRRPRQIDVERDATSIFGPDMMEFLVEERYVNGRPRC